MRIERLRVDHDDGEPEVVVADANAANGMCLAPDGGLFVCEQGSHRRIARISHVDPNTGCRETVIAETDGAPLSSPNDIVVTADGSIWFTDPSYGFLQGFRPRPQVPDGVRRGSTGGGVAETVTAVYDKPNGLALSPDGRELYVGDSGANHEPGTYDADRPHDVWRHPLSADGRLGARQRVAVVAPGFPDGLKTFRDGLIYVSCFAGVLVLDRDGTTCELIDLPGAVNFCFGGADGSTLFVTNDTGVWAATPTRDRDAVIDFERTYA